MFEDSVSIPSIWASMNSWFTPTVLFVLLNVVIGTIAFTSSLANPKQPNQEETHGSGTPQQPKLGRSPSALQRLRSINFYAYRSQEPQSVATHFNSNPDSETQQTQATETESRYLFEDTHLENPMETETQFVSEQDHVTEHPNKETQYLFEDTHLENPMETETRFVSEQDHEIEHPNTETQSVIAQNHEEAEEEEEDLKTLDEVYNQVTGHHVTRTMSDTNPSASEAKPRLQSKMKKSGSLKLAFGHFHEETDVVESRRPATVREGKVTEGDDEVDAKADDFINKFKQQLKLQRLDSFTRYKDMISRGSSK